MQMIQNLINTVNHTRSAQNKVEGSNSDQNGAGNHTNNRKTPIGSAPRPFQPTFLPRVESLPGKEKLNQAVNDFNTILDE